MLKKDERWNWFRVCPGYWCEIGYNRKSVMLKFQNSKHAVWHTFLFSPAIAQDLGDALLRAAGSANRLKKKS